MVSRSVNQLINPEAVYRTAPATPGLLISFPAPRIFIQISLFMVKTIGFYKFEKLQARYICVSRAKKRTYTKSGFFSFSKKHSYVHFLL